MAFNPFKEKIDFSCANLIEASAGTGKTYSITAIYLRLILEKNLLPSDILTVTFTVDATEELKRRIRAVIRDSYNFFLHGDDNLLQDKNLKDYLKNFVKDDKDKFLIRLRESLMSLDDAPIYTIHKFCKRILLENPIETGIPLNVDFSSKEDEFIDEMIFYVYRKWLYKEDYFVAEIFFDEFLKNSKIKEIVRKSISTDNIEFEDFNKYIDSVKKTIESLIDEYERAKQNYVADGKKYLKQLFSSDFKDYRNLLSALKKVCDNKSFEREYPELVRLYKEILENYYRYIATRVLDTLKDAKKYADSLKNSSNTLTFSDLINLVFNAVSYGNLRNNTFQALLVDEFQDTDFLQVYIFEHLFKDKTSFYIGDPKQSIYGFRNADLSAYFYATRSIDAAHRFSLDVCYRSTRGLIEAFNKIFSQEGFFVDRRIVYKPLTFQKTPKAEIICNDSDKDFNFYFFKDETRKTDILPYIAGKIGNLLDNADIVEENSVGRQLEPQDICILTRNNSDAENIRDYLSKNDIKCSLTTTKSVFSTKQAKEILSVLKAINNFTNTVYVKSAIVSDIFHRTINEALEEHTVSHYKERFRLYKEYLNKKGVMACFLHIFNMENSKVFILNRAGGERAYANYLHIFELLQDTQKKEKLTTEKLIKYLLSKINDVSYSKEEEELRLESDENAVKISTIHKSKGLEFPVVFLVYFTGLTKKNDGLALTFKFDEHEERHKAIFEKNDLRDEEAETSRLFYVALTRAMSRCYLFDYKRRGRATINKLAYGGKNSPNEIVEFLKNRFSDVAAIKTKYIGINRQSNKSKAEKSTQLAFKPFGGRIKSLYALSSYSSLVKSRDISFEEELIEEFTADKPPAADAILKPGAKTGSLIHKILEKIDFKTTDDELRNTIVNELIGYSDEAIVYVFDMIKRVLDSPFDLENNKFRLRDIENGKRISEMKFYISINSINKFLDTLHYIFKTKGDNEFCARLDLINPENIKHYLIGFIDLVFEFENRIYVVDWKTNYLGDSFLDYSKDNLHKEIVANNYFLQFGIYQLAVYKYILSLDANLDSGESFYIFTRGFDPANNRGIYRYAFKKDELDELAKCVE